MVRDENNESYVSVPKTDAWHDDNKNAHYILQCSLLSRQPPNTLIRPPGVKRTNFTVGLEKQKTADELFVRSTTILDG